jgi:nitrate/TMAO reductase-like tetraheme cytochrome c subunit
MGLTKSAPSCSSCHGKHTVHPKDEALATTHPQDRRHLRRLPHHDPAGMGRQRPRRGHGRQEGQPGVRHLPRTACHEEPLAAETRHQVSDGCGNCHERLLATFKDSFHGKATSLNNKKAAACADCHTPHHNLPASDKRSSVHKDNLAKTCGACHKNVNASFLTFDPHANPSDPKRNAYVYWIWLGMTSLLIGVFGFFGLHGLLWLQRALVGKLRGEFHFGHTSSGPYVRRFSSMQMGCTFPSWSASCCWAPPACR